MERGRPPPAEKLHTRTPQRTLELRALLGVIHKNVDVPPNTHTPNELKNYAESGPDRSVPDGPFLADEERPTSRRRVADDMCTRPERKTENRAALPSEALSR